MNSHKTQHSYLLLHFCHQYQNKIDFVQNLIQETERNNLTNTTSSDNGAGSDSANNDNINALRSNVYKNGKKGSSNDATLKLRDLFKKRINSTEYINNEMNHIHIRLPQ